MIGNLTYAERADRSLSLRRAGATPSRHVKFGGLKILSTVRIGQCGCDVFGQVKAVLVAAALVSLHAIICIGVSGGAGVFAASVALAGERPRVIAVNFPLAYFAQRLSGSAVEVVLPVPPGRDPAFWRPAIADIASIQSADLILLNGAGFASWTSKVSLPRSRLVDTSRGFRERFIATETVTHSHGADGQHSHTGTASFTWLDLALASKQAGVVADRLVRLLPQDGAAIKARLTKLTTDLTALDTAARGLGAKARGRVLIATHPRYQYLARAYDLTIRALAWDAGAMPDEAEWSAMDRLLEQNPGALVLWEAAPPAAARERLQKRGVRDVVFPTHAMPPDGGDFVQALGEQLGRLSAALDR